MPSKPTLVLTRPEALSGRTASLVRAALGDTVEVVLAPVMEIVGTGQAIDVKGYEGVILTSTNALEFAPDLSDISVYCVGKRTAAAAREAGADVRLVAEDAEKLVSKLSATGPLVHLRAVHARGDIAKRLTLAGIETHEAVIYDQRTLTVSAKARELIEGNAPVVLPLYSPRSAQLAGEGIEAVGPRVHVVAMSDAVRDVWHATTGGEAEVCDHPDGDEMLKRIIAALRD